MPTPRTMPEALEEAARTSVGFTFVSGRDETFVSYAEMRCRAIQVAGALREAGFQRGDLVAIVLADAAEFLATLFGASMAGVIPASLYPPATTSDLPRYLELTSAILRSSGARAVITTNGLVPEFDRIRARCPELTQVLAHDNLRAPCDDPPDPPKIDDIAFRSRTRTSRRTSTRSMDRRAWGRRDRTWRSAGCRSTMTWDW